MNMFINEPILMNMFINEQRLMNMFINEPFLVERRPTLSILDRACQASSRAIALQLKIAVAKRLSSSFKYVCVYGYFDVFCQRVCFCLTAILNRRIFYAYSASSVVQKRFYSSTLNFSEMFGLTGNSGCPCIIRSESAACF